MSDNSFQQMDDRFSRFMFGDRTRRGSAETKSDEEEVDVEEFEIGTDTSDYGSTSEIPYLELMEQIDRLMTSLSTFKPLLKRATPFIEKLLSKIE
ncbi:hypothetical protein GCM10008967_01510 [Bacillus carboniphilus]|uniref:Spore coat protein n=1 Tax=Bacillus carboniphilus TaxID=86663 RepID=A0ABN0VQL2_9BACI